MKRRVLRLAFGLCIVGWAWGILRAEAPILPADAQAIANAGGRFDHGYTRNPVEILHLDQAWNGGAEGLSHLKNLGTTTALALSRVEISDEGFKAIAAMPRLKTMWMSDVSVSDEGWRQLQGSDTLEFLSISHMTSQVAVRLRGMKHLKSVSIENNPAQTTLELVDLPALREIRIYNIGQLRAGSRAALACEWSGLPQLEELSLSELVVSGIHLPDFKSVKILTLWVVQWDDARDSSFSGLTKLERVRLHDPPVSDAMVQALHQNPALSFVEIHGDHLSDAAFEGLRGLPELQELHFSSTSLTDASMAHLKDLPKLHTLTIDFAPHLTDASFDAIAQLPALAHLKVNFTAVDDAALDRLKGLKSLQDIEAEHNPISPEALRLFRATLHPAPPK